MEGIWGTDLIDGPMAVGDYRSQGHGSGQGALSERCWVCWCCGCSRATGKERSDPGVVPGGAMGDLCYKRAGQAELGVYLLLAQQHLDMRQHQIFGG